MNLGGLWRKWGGLRGKHHFVSISARFIPNILPWMMLLLQGRFSMGPFGTWFDGACWLLMGSIDLSSSLSLAPALPLSTAGAAPNGKQQTTRASPEAACPTSPSCHHHRSGCQWWRKQITPGLIPPKVWRAFHLLWKEIIFEIKLPFAFCETAQIKENNPKLPQKVHKSSPSCSTAGQEKEPQEIHCEKGREEAGPEWDGRCRRMSAVQIRNRLSLLCVKMRFNGWMENLCPIGWN